MNHWLQRIKLYQGLHGGPHVIVFHFHHHVHANVIFSIFSSEYIRYNVKVVQFWYKRWMSCASKLLYQTTWSKKKINISGDTILSKCLTAIWNSSVADLDHWNILMREGTSSLCVLIQVLLSVRVAFLLRKSLWLWRLFWEIWKMLPGRVNFLSIFREKRRDWDWRLNLLCFVEVTDTHDGYIICFIKPVWVRTRLIWAAAS